MSTTKDIQTDVEELEFIQYLAQWGYSSLEECPQHKLSFIRRVFYGWRQAQKRSTEFETLRQQRLTERASAEQSPKPGDVYLLDAEFGYVEFTGEDGDKLAQAFLWLVVIGRDATDSDFLYCVTADDVSTFIGVCDILVKPAPSVLRCGRGIWLHKDALLLQEARRYDVLDQDSTRRAWSIVCRLAQGKLDFSEATPEQRENEDDSDYWQLIGLVDVVLDRIFKRECVDPNAQLDADG